ncbi:acyltransferase family protein [Georgenia deserti]|uniref:Acyltransferase n=1 Tax=Georgenia deserti TaxID=2093781 RepID=A0ABW4L5Z6_9MICO
MNSEHPASSASAVRRPAEQGRLYWIDTVRIALTALVVAHHCALTYGNIPIWFYNEPSRDPSGSVLDILVVANQSYFMGLFFLISGYFVPASVDRKGPGGFARERLIRLGVPILVFMVVVRPVADYWSWRYSDSALPYLTHYMTTMDPGPTWFLEVLLIFSLLYAGCRRWVPVRRCARLSASDGRLPGMVAARTVTGLILIMGVLMALWRQIVPDGTYWPVVGLPTPAFLPQYALMFSAGVLAARRRWLERMPSSIATLGGGVSLVALLLLAPFALSPDPVVAGIAGGFAMAVLGVGISAVVLVAFRRFAPGRGPKRQFLSDNAFAVYVIHPAVLVVVALLLREVPAPAIVKFAALASLSLPACWGLAALLRRSRLVRRIA